MTRKAKEKRIRKFMIKYALTRKEARESTALWDKCVKEVEEEWDEWNLHCQGNGLSQGNTHLFRRGIRWK